MKKEIVKERLAFKKEAYAKLMDAYLALIDGGVKSYTIDNRQLSKFDLAEIKRELESLEEQIDALEAMLDGKAPRKAFAVIPKDW